MRGKNRAVVPWHMHIDPALKERVQAMAAADGRPTGRLIEEIIGAYVAERVRGEAGVSTTDRAVIR